MKTWHRAASILIAGLSIPGFVDCCGPFLFEEQFTTFHHVMPGAFQSGHPGILRPHFYRADLLVAYRVLSGLPLGPKESPVALSEPPPAENRADSWVVLRGNASVHPDKKMPGSDYQEFPNCLEPAFVTAADTFRRLRAKWGASSPEFEEWVTGQDQVFTNCSGEPSIPQRLTAGDPLLIAERNYQIAAAEFYAGQYDKAAAGFDAIATDSKSPWHDMGAYLAARACLRAGTIGKDDAKLQEAETRLTAIHTDAAKSLLPFVQALANPNPRLAALGKQLMQPGSDLPRIVTDYTRIWDSLEMQGKKIEAPDSDVTDWIAKFQRNNGKPAVEIWQEKQTLPWLIAALVWTNPGNQSLVNAAHAVAPSSPGYPTAAYYGMIMQMRLGDTVGARRWADEALTHKESESVTNMFRSVRFSLVQNWSDFLRFAPRIPVATGDYEEDSDVPLNALKPLALDRDGADSFNDAVPLSLWVDAVASNLLPREIRADLAQAGWVRAAVLNDLPVARVLAAHVGAMKPELAQEMSAWASEKESPEASFAAVFLMLRAPGLHPVIRSGFQRETPVLTNDSLRDNWWQLNKVREAEPDGRDHVPLVDLYPQRDYGPKEFLTPEQKKAGATEYAKLIARAANSTAYLCTETMNWANVHPKDARIPQALHLCVEATHYGPSDKTTHPLSKQAFELLHRKYPNSEWDSKTKYWY